MENKLKLMARAMQKENRPKNSMLNSDQQDAKESKTFPAYMALAKAAWEAISPETPASIGPVEVTQAGLVDQAAKAICLSENDKLCGDAPCTTCHIHAEVALKAATPSPALEEPEYAPKDRVRAYAERAGKIIEFGDPGRTRTGRLLRDLAAELERGAEPESDG